MKKTLLTSCAIVVAILATAGLPQMVVRNKKQAPQVPQPAVTLASKTHRVAPAHVRLTADQPLQAAFSVQGAESQKAVWQVNFDEGAAGWTLGRDANDYFGWELKKSSGTQAFGLIDENDVQSLFIEGPYQIYRRSIARATGPAIDVPQNGVLHAYIGYSQNMNTYAVLSIEASTDGFENSVELWNSTLETGETAWRWHKIEVGLNDYAGKKVAFRFTYGPGISDNVFRTGGYMADYYIDGLQVTGVSSVDHIDVATGEPVNFVDLSTGDVAQWEWQFEGGTPATSTEAAPTVVYKNDGAYSVSLTVTDAQGTTSSVTRERFVNVTGTAPVARIMPPATFRYDDTHLPMVCPLVPVQYRDASSGFPTQWQWNFTGTTPAASAQENPLVAYDFMHEQSVTLQVANEHGSSSDALAVSAEYEGYISNLLSSDYPITRSLDGEGTFPGSNRMRINAYAERFSAPSRPILVYGALVFFETATAEALTDQIANVGVHLCKSEDGKPGKQLDSMWWRVFELATSTSTTLRGTLFEFTPQVVDEEFFIMVDGIPEWNDSCNVSFAMASLRDHDNTAYIKLRDQWRPVTGFFDRDKSQTSFYIMPLIAHSVITFLPTSTQEVRVPAQGGSIDQQLFALFGYNTPEVDADWCRITSTPNELTLDTLKIECDALPAGTSSRVATITVTDRINASTATLRIVQSAGLAGDVNGDGEVDVNDVNILINIILGTDDAEKYDGRADVNGSGGIDVSDVNALLNIILGKDDN